MKIIDSHVHFWDPIHLHYPWLDDLEPLKQPFLPTDYAQAARGTDIGGLVFVQADCLPEQAMEEVDWVMSLDAPMSALVAYAPLELGEAARPYLDQLETRPLVKGVRRLIQSEEADFALRTEFVHGIQLLAEYDFSFDICIRHHQLPAINELVRQCPTVNFVLDHIGKPDIAKGDIEDWRFHMSTLSGFTNVWCKLSGVITEAHWDLWTPDVIKPYLDHVLNVFSIDRVMFGSDWPVVKMAGSFNKWLDALLEVFDSLNEIEKDKLFSENTRQFYRLEETNV